MDGGGWGDEDGQSVGGIQDTSTLSDPTQSLNSTILFFFHTRTKRRIHTWINQVYCREYHPSRNQCESPSSTLRIRTNQVRRRGGRVEGEKGGRMRRIGARGNGKGI